LLKKEREEERERERERERIPLSIHYRICVSEIDSGGNQNGAANRAGSLDPELTFQKDSSVLGIKEETYAFPISVRNLAR